MVIAARYDEPIFCVSRPDPVFCQYSESGPFPARQKAFCHVEFGCNPDRLEILGEYLISACKSE